MKILSFIVPCYNSQDYMEHCINTLLSGGERVEIILVNDGSKDNTGAIADKYADEYPDIIRVIHQQNGGHGSGINAGLKVAVGKYIKVVDSDDWVDTAALATVIETLEFFERDGRVIDLFINNYVYEYSTNNTRHYIRYKGIYPQNKVFGWNEVNKFDPTRYLIMHSTIFRTELLKSINLTLPRHMFYVDNIFVYTPLPVVKTMYYINVDLYRYFIGRQDQSVNEKVMVGRVDQQIKIISIMLKTHNLKTLKYKNRKLANFMANYLSIMYTIANALLALDTNPTAKKKKYLLWLELRSADYELYKKIRYRSLAFFMSLPGGLGKKTSILLYKITRHFYKFN